MKILHVAQKLPGGPASYLGEILPYQQALFGAGNVLVSGCEAELNHVADFPGSDFRPFRSSSRSPRHLLDFMTETMAVIRRDRPDLVHLHSSFSGLLRYPISRLPDNVRPAVVYCPHGWAFNIATNGLRRRLYALVERTLAGKSDATIVISRFEHATAIAKRLPAGNMHVVRNGIAETPPSIVPPPVPFDPAKINLLFIGRLDRQKGFDVLREAMMRIADAPVHLHMLGANVVDGDGAGVGDMDNLTMHGWIPRREVFGFINAADAVVMPSRWEGFGLAAIEAMRQGKPVIASQVDALPEVIGDAGFFVPPADPVMLAQTLAALDRPMLARLGEKARGRFVANFTAERLNRELFEVYRAALAARYGPGLGPVPPLVPADRQPMAEARKIA
ncbi:glycosyltransferase [Novosphingobium colocasiae]|uniref:Glycosyl transferase n=2 Tax=Bacteria TaxID=2 RepID=A0A918PCJ4_9SPHN|nr:glycosyltransferase [Novosphingobium colocasiae]GGY96663.1 glycosyl transferase [Novosphingobium colocasiae]